MFRRKFKKIEPGSGLGQLQFGLGKQKIIEIVGEPDKKYKEVFEGTRLVEVWDYENLGLSLKFDGEEILELSSMSIISSYYTYNGKSIIGKTFGRVIKILKNTTYQEVSPKGVTDKKLLYAPDINLIVWFERDIATSLSWDISDVDIHLGTWFTEKQREEVRKELIEYRETRKEFEKLKKTNRRAEENKTNERNVKGSEKNRQKKSGVKKSNKNVSKKNALKIFSFEIKILDLGVLISSVLNLAVVIVSTVMALIGNTALFAPIAIIFGAMFLYFNDEDIREYRNRKRKKKHKKNSKPKMLIHNKVLLFIILSIAFFAILNRSTEHFNFLYGSFIFFALVFIVSFVLNDWHKE